MNQIELRFHASQALADHLTKMGCPGVKTLVLSRFSEPCATFIDGGSTHSVFAAISMRPGQVPQVEEREAFLLSERLGVIAFFAPMRALIEEPVADRSPRVRFAIDDIHLL
ncbi:MAG: hypothetical protein EBX52_14925, partial [Proteobacteria bacterium]|nr:hypothetical protein [Pseudomonadota bacterium]